MSFLVDGKWRDYKSEQLREPLGLKWCNPWTSYFYYFTSLTYAWFYQQVSTRKPIFLCLTPTCNSKYEICSFATSHTRISAILLTTLWFTFMPIRLHLLKFTRSLDTISKFLKIPYITLALSTLPEHTNMVASAYWRWVMGTFSCLIFVASSKTNSTALEINRLSPSAVMRYKKGHSG